METSVVFFTVESNGEQKSKPPYLKAYTLILMPGNQDMTSPISFH